jgi:palmitoyltransferase ZDHHC13/17
MGPSAAKAKKEKTSARARKAFVLIARCLDGASAQHGALSRSMTAPQSVAGHGGGGGGGDGGIAPPAPPPPPPASSPTTAPDEFCRACARGDLAAVHAGARALASTPDSRGFHPLQWAALNDQAAVVSVLLAAGAPRAAADPAGQTALHWSAARGAVSAAAVLVSADDDDSGAVLLAAADAQGYTPLHVAAQHDAASWIAAAARGWPGGLALARSARDSHGRTPLTWAAYKGALAAARLLIVLGADVSAVDEEGAAPLHWAALRGHADVCLALIRAGGAGGRVGGAALLGLRDGTGARPADLARSKGFASLADRLEAEAAKAGVVLTGDGFAATTTTRRPRSLVRSCGRAVASAHLAPLTLALVAGLTWAFEAGVVRAPGAPPPSSACTAAGWAVAALALAGGGFLVATARADPGVLPVHPALEGEGDSGNDGDAAALLLAQPAPDFGRLCVACRTVRPPRAKHCGATGRCIARFDHYCPWVGCAVGAGNTGRFFAMLACWTAAAGGAALATAVRLTATVAAMSKDEKRAVSSSTPIPVSGAAGAAGGMAAFLLFDGACALAVAVLTAVQARQISTNLTTAEAVGGPRKYSYLRGPGGRGFSNPFDRGSCWGNWMDVMMGGGWSSGSVAAAPRRRGGGIAARGRGVRGLLAAEESDSGLHGGSSSPPAGRRRPANRGLEMV